MNYEKEIDKILNSLDFNNNNYKPLGDVLREKEIMIDKAFEKYMHYEENIKNKPSIIEELKEYQYIPFEEVCVGDTLRQLKIKPYFFNIRLMGITKITDKNAHKFKLRNSCFKKNCEDIYFFKQIPKNDIVKMKLMELIQDT